MTYRNKVRDTVDGILKTFPLKCHHVEHPGLGFLDGMETRPGFIWKHSVIIRQLPIKIPARSFWRAAPPPGIRPGNSLVLVPPGTVSLGKDKGHSLYGWDNEYGTLTAKVDEFHAGQISGFEQGIPGFTEDGRLPGHGVVDRGGME